MVCSRRRQLLADYLERVHALSVEMELLLREEDKLSDTSDGWYRVEQNPEEIKVVLVRGREKAPGWLRIEEARIQSDIARLALETHTANHRC